MRRSVWPDKLVSVSINKMFTDKLEDVSINVNKHPNGEPSNFQAYAHETVIIIIRMCNLRTGGEKLM